MKRNCLLAFFTGATLFIGCGVSEGGEVGGGGFEYNGLYWQVGPDQDMTWNEAKEWVTNLEGEWRMPTREELRSLWDKGINCENWGSFENSGRWVWSGELQGSTSGWPFAFNFGFGTENCHSPYAFNVLRAFAVRSR